MKFGGKLLSKDNIDCENSNNSLNEGNFTDSDDLSNDRNDLDAGSSIIDNRNIVYSPKITRMRDKKTLDDALNDSNIENGMIYSRLNSNHEIKNIGIFKNVKHILTSTMRTRILICLFSERRNLKSLGKN
jgi:hypothetical protein